VSQDPHLRRTKKLLFDGETALRSAALQDKILKDFGVQVHAESGFKRNQAERGVKEIKLRTTLFMKTRGTTFFSH